MKIVDNFLSEEVYKNFVDALQNEKSPMEIPGLVARVEKTFTDCGFEILNNFGTFFMVRKVRFQSLYMIPLNADEMYFEVLRKELITL